MRRAALDRRHPNERGGTRTGPRTRLLLRVALLVLTIGIVTVLGGALVMRGDAALEGRSLNELLVPLLLAFGAWTIAPLFIGIGWIVLLADTTAVPREARAPLLAAFLLGWAARYIPGKVPALAGRIYLASGLGIARRPLIAATAVGSVLELLVAAALGSGLLVVALGAGAGAGGWGYGAGGLLALAALAALHPRVSTALINRILRHARRDPVPAGEMPGAHALVLAGLCIAVAHALSGASVLVILAAVGAAGWSDAPFIVGASAFAGVVGIAASIIPAGLGVREGALAATLSIRFAAGPAALAPILTRAVSVPADAVLLLAALAYDHASGGRLRTRLLSGRANRPDDAVAIDAKLVTTSGAAPHEDAA